MSTVPPPSRLSSPAGTRTAPAQRPEVPGFVSSPAEREQELARQWERALEQARRSEEGRLLPSQLFCLVSWPNLTRLPRELALPAARVCALLWQKPTAGFLVPKVLGTPAEETLVLLQALKTLGHVDIARPSASRGDGAVPEAALQAPRPLAADSLLGRLWQRLTAQH